jgi:hypothetical protein
MTRNAKAGAAVLAGLIVAGALWASGSATAANDPGSAAIGWASKINNPYFPLPVGTTLIYQGVRDGVTQIDRVHVTHKTKMIQGVSCTAVHDVARHHGRLLEKTTDWYAQDAKGNVWYFGEATATYDKNGHVQSREGSWRSGRDGAVRGIIMEATPHVPDGYRQEFYPGHAEDAAWILSRGGAMKIPYGRVHRVIRTMEWSRIEPDVVVKKFYAPGLGIVVEHSVAGEHETAKLVRVIT